MQKRENVPAEKLASSRQMAEVYGMLIKAVPDLSHSQAQHFIGRQREVAKQVRAIFTVADPYAEQVLAWETFYGKVFGITADLSDLQVPGQRSGSGWLIAVQQGLTIERALVACTSLFTVWRWTNDDLDKLTESVRSAANGSYAVWVRARVEADQEHANKSYNDLHKAGVPGITLLERLLLELKYFSETGQHLDLQNVTLCAGSLYQDWRDRCVPVVRWFDGRLYVNWCYRVGAVGDLRSREVVVN